TMNMVWVVLNTWNIYTQFRNGAFTPRMWSALAIGLPCAAIGFFLGMGFLKRINREQFLRIVYLVLLFIGANMLITSLMAVL
ncbi:MAG: sulfite exporter TauE/SafE family protein, partial [Hungatella sp.]